MQLPLIEYKNNQGVILLLCLIFLLISTLIGVSSLRSNLFSEKISSNAMRRIYATETAESALLEGEELVQNSYLSIISSLFDATGRIPTDQASNCTTIINGEGGICVPIEYATSTQLTNIHQHWQNSSSRPSIWEDQGRYRVTNQATTKATETAKFIVEFLGYVSDQNGSNCSHNDPNAAQWPYCPIDQPLFRITSFAASGNHNEARIILQSTYIINLGRQSWREQ